MSVPSIFLASDYGRDDEFAGVLHAVLATLAPGVPVVDLSHGIAPYDVAGGAALLARAAPFLGDGVLCAVVDPGVGGPRRGVVLERSGEGPQHLVGPDNGLLLEAARVLGSIDGAVELPRPPRTSSRTFDGRDLFAPAAARLVAGAPLDAVGTRIELSSLVELATAPVTSRELDDGRLAISAPVRWIDRYGNVQLALPGDVLGAARTAGVVSRTDDALVRVVETFSDLEQGMAGLLCDANGSVALVVGQGSAARRFEVAVGDRVELVGDFGSIT